MTTLTIDGSLRGLNLPGRPRRARAERRARQPGRQGRHQGGRHRRAARRRGRSSSAATSSPRSTAEIAHDSEDLASVDRRQEAGRQGQGRARARRRKRRRRSTRRRLARAPAAERRAARRRRRRRERPGATRLTALRWRRVPDAPRIKFCGITALDDAELAVDAGAWAVGCILWPGSPRAATRPRPRGSPPRCAARSSLRRVRQRAARRGDAAGRRLGLTMVQLHGDEGPAFCAEVARRTGAKVIKAAPVRGPADMRALEALPHRLPPARRPPRRAARRHGRDVRLGARAQRAARRSRSMLSGGLHAEQRRRGDRRRARRSPSTSPAAPRPRPASRTPKLRRSPPSSPTAGCRRRRAGPRSRPRERA